ncbi:MAG: polysaccharide biosynthesis protein [Sulfurospirillum sp.]|nr:polysaccharide biosynthesis protein [Sulfurospirillum sp.]
MFTIDRRVLNLAVIALLSFITFVWTFWIFHQSIRYDVILIVIFVRIIASIAILKDYSLSWSKVSQKTFLIKSLVYIVAFCAYMPFYHGEIRIAFFLSELFFYLFSINVLMYGYYLFVNKSTVKKDKSLVIYGAGRAGLKLKEEFKNSEYKIKFFIDDNKSLHKRSIDSVAILSRDRLKKFILEKKIDLLVIAMPSVDTKIIYEIYHELKFYFEKIQILPSLNSILTDSPFSKQLKDISIEDLLARHPKDLDKKFIGNFLKGKKVFISGAGGSIGSEICRQCLRYGASHLYALDHSEYNLYALMEELADELVTPLMFSVLNLSALEESMRTCKPDIVIHAAAYKHVPLVEANIEQGIQNNVQGTKNIIDMAIKYEVQKCILISTDKAVRPTNVMGATKRICELYAANVMPEKTQIVAVRFGNVLGSSGSVIPKFRTQIGAGGPITVTHPQITRYFMLIPEACELVLQAGAIGKASEVFILDMGEPIKIVDLAKRMIELSGVTGVEIEFSGLRPGEKLYEELLIDEADAKTQYPSIMVAKNTPYPIAKLQADIQELLTCKDKLAKLKEIVPEFNHQIN